MASAGIVYTLTIDAAAAARVGAQAALTEVTDTTRQVLNRATVLTPVRTGRLRAGNQMRVRLDGDKAVGEVFNNTEYAAAVHNGTRAHTVVPRRRKVLRFVVDGRVVFSARAVIPARAGRPWLKRALLEVAAARGYTVTGL